MLDFLFCVVFRICCVFILNAAFNCWFLMLVNSFEGRATIRGTHKIYFSNNKKIGKRQIALHQNIVQFRVQLQHNSFVWMHLLMYWQENTKNKREKESERTGSIKYMRREGSNCLQISLSFFSWCYQVLLFVLLEVKWLAYTHTNHNYREKKSLMQTNQLQNQVDNPKQLNRITASNNRNYH